MGQEDILNEIVTRGDVLSSDLSKKFKPKGPVSLQLKALRKKGLIARKLVNRQFIYFPTAEALELVRQAEKNNIEEYSKTVCPKCTVFAGCTGTGNDLYQCYKHPEWRKNK